MTIQNDTLPAVFQAHARTIAGIAARLANEDVFGTGPLAELRRLDPQGALAEVALHRLLARHVSEAAISSHGLAQWALAIHALALAAPDHLRFPPRSREPNEPERQAEFWGNELRRARPRLGRALFEAGYSEHRFGSLLNGTARELPVALPRAVRFLVAAGERVPALGIAEFVMSAEETDDDWANAVRQGIARGYYRAEFRAENPQGDAA